MEFNPDNPIVRLCLRGMAMDEKGQAEEAGELFLQAWKEGTHDYERIIAAYHIARHQKNISDQLQWLETTLALALKLNNASVKSAFPFLYERIAKCYEALNDPENVKKSQDMANSFSEKPTDKGPFYHGTKAGLRIGEMLTAGGRSNYQAGLTMNHIYFTASVHGAGLAAVLAKGDGEERVYIIEPTGSFENDPNVTNKKFPGNPTRSYRSESPLKIVGEVTDWARQTTEEIQKWKEKVAKNEEKIIN